MFEGYIAGKFANKMFEKDVFKIVKNHAMGGALIMLFPLFCLDWIIYICILWICIMLYAKRLAFHLILVV